MRYRDYRQIVGVNHKAVLPGTASAPSIEQRMRALEADIKLERAKEEAARLAKKTRDGPTVA